MAEAPPPRSCPLTDSQRAFVASTARCLLWFAEVSPWGHDRSHWDIAFANEAEARRFLPVDQTPDEPYASAFYRARVEEDREACDERAQLSIFAGLDYAQEFRVTLTDGCIRWLREDVHVAEVAAARWHLSGVITDITDRRATEEALRLSESSYRQLVDSIPQVAWLQAPDGRVEYLNYRYFEVTGQTHFGGDAMDWQSVIHPADWPLIEHSYLSAFDAPRPWEAEMRIRTAEGTYRWFFTRIVPVKNASGETVRWFGTSTDIHTRKSVEEELERRVQERTRELTRAYDEMEAFNYSVSHDLRAPARAINFACNVLLSEFGTSLPTEAQGELERAMTAASRMGRLIDELLQYSRLQRREVVRAPVDLSVLARMVWEELNTPPAAVLYVEPDLRDVADPSLIRVVLQNLIENAAKFSSRVAQPCVEFGRDADGRYFVRDNGAGYDPAYAEKLFLPFQRLHRSDEFPGTGIGLANVRRILERHGGRIWSSGAPGTGATFWFTLHPETDPSFKEY